MAFDNAAKRVLCDVAIGRKSWLFAGSDRGGDRAAMIYRLAMTAKLNAWPRRPGSPTRSRAPLSSWRRSVRTSCHGTQAPVTTRVNTRPKSGYLRNPAAGHAQT